MAAVLITVAWRGRRRDLVVPADLPIVDLLRPLAAALRPGGTHPATGTHPAPGTHPATGTHPASATYPATGPLGHTAAGVEAAAPSSGGAGPDWAGPGRVGWGRVDPGAGLALAPLGGAPLPVHATLAACGVGHGAVLVLIERSGLHCHDLRP